MATKSKKTGKQRSDTAVQGTNDSSIVSKCSAASLGYFTDDYLQHFVAKKVRRSPLMNRGYYIRAKAVDHCFTKFLQSHPGTPKQVISLGAGFDSAYWRLKSQGFLAEAVYIEVDFPDLCNRKRRLIESKSALNDLPVDVQDTAAYPSIVLRSKDYSLLGVDLTKLELLNSTLRACSVNFDLPTMFLSEVALTYMAPKHTAKLIQWIASEFPNSVFINYEQILPYDAFGIVMVNHFKKIGSPLKNINNFPTREEQIQRYKNLGWDACQLADMNQFYQNFISSQERQHIECLEPFDEFEEWHLKCMHYIMLAAGKGSGNETVNQIFNQPITDGQKLNQPIREKLEGYTQNRPNRNHADKSCDQNQPIITQSKDNGSVIDSKVHVTLYNQETTNGGLKRFGHSSTIVHSDWVLTVGGFGEINGKHERIKQLHLLNIKSGCQSYLSSIIGTGISGPPVMNHHGNAEKLSQENLEKESEENTDITDDKDTDGAIGETVKEVDTSDSLQSQQRVLSDVSNTGASTRACKKSGPLERLYCTTTVLRDGRILVFGGRLSPMQTCDYMYVLDEIKEAISQITTTKINMEVSPPGRKHQNDAACEKIKNQGCDSEKHQHDNEQVQGTSGAMPQTGTADGDELGSFPVISCRQVHASGDGPCGRWRHTATVVEIKGEEQVIIFGGQTVGNVTLGDCYILDTKLWKWTQIVTSGPSPEARHSHSCDVWRGHLVVAGGLNSNQQPLDSVWRLDIECWTWNKIAIHGFFLPRYSHTSAVIDEKLLLLGGITVQPEVTPGVACVDLTTGRCQEYSLPATDPERPLMVHNHTSVQLDNGRHLVVGGGGNCFSFGTHLNECPHILDYSRCFEQESGEIS